MFVFENEKTCAVVTIHTHRIAAPAINVRSWATSADCDAVKAAELWHAVRDAIVMVGGKQMFAADAANQAIVTYFMREGYEPKL